MSFNFMAAVTICSDFGAQDNKVCHCFHCFPIYLPLSNGTGCHDLSFLNVELEASFFTLLFHFHQEALQFLLAFFQKGGVIYYTLRLFHTRCSPKRSETCPKMCTVMFIAALFVAKCPSSGECIYKLCSICKMEYYSAIKTNELCYSFSWWFPWWLRW